MAQGLFWTIVFVASLVVLIYSADFFIKAAEKIGLKFGIPPFIIGMTLVALGTSLPELITSVIAVLNDSSEIVTGNVSGSNITNICLVLGMIGALRKQTDIGFDMVKVDLPLMIGSAMLLALAAWDGVFSLWEGLLFLAGFGIYMAYVFGIEQPEASDSSLEELSDTGKFGWKEPLILLASGVAIYFSASYNVNAIIHLAEIFSIGKEVIALTAVALGTSLPELVVSIVAVRNNSAEMAIGNILGSNIFNVFAVMGIPSLFGKLVVAETIVSFGLPFMVLVSILTFFILQDKRITRWEGLILLLFYVFFVGNMIANHL